MLFFSNDENECILTTPARATATVAEGGAKCTSRSSKPLNDHKIGRLPDSCFEPAAAAATVAALGAPAARKEARGASRGGTPDPAPAPALRLHAA
eukprot:scaffold293_cov121-Isochrysis_galbana.AAC.10